MTYRSAFFVFLLLLAIPWPSPLYAQSLCDASSTQTVYNPTRFGTVLTDFNTTLPDSTSPLYDVVEVAFFLPGVNPATGGAPITSTQVTRAALKLEGADCYTGALSAVPTAARALATRKVRTTPEPESGPWGPLTNPFARLAALTPPGATRAGK